MIRRISNGRERELRLHSSAEILYLIEECGDFSSETEAYRIFISLNRSQNRLYILVEFRWISVAFQSI